MQHHNVSKVARLRQEIAEREEAARLALYGPAIVARHEIITKKMEIYASYHQQLIKQYGDQLARDRF